MSLDCHQIICNWKRSRRQMFFLLFVHLIQITYDEEHQVKKLTSPLESWLSRTEFRHSRSRSRAVTRGCKKNNPFRNMTIQLYRERQLWSGNESVRIRYVNGNFVAGTSASSPGVPRHIRLN